MGGYVSEWVGGWVREREHTCTNAQSENVRCWCAFTMYQRAESAQSAFNSRCNCFQALCV